MGHEELRALPKDYTYESGSLIALLRRPHYAVYDYDGTLADTSRQKDQAFYDAGAHYLGSAGGEALLEVHRMAGSMSREEQIRTFLSAHTAQPVSEELVWGIYKRIADQMSGGVPDLIPGVYKHLMATEQIATKFVVSGAPSNEVVAGIAKAGLSHFFHAVEGDANPKERRLRELREWIGRPEWEIPYFGDTYDDMVQAELAGYLPVLIRGHRSDYASFDDFNDLEYVVFRK